MLVWPATSSPAARTWRPSSAPSSSLTPRADRLGLDDDQRHSLVWQHAGQVAQLTARARTDLVGSVPRPGPGRRAQRPGSHQPPRRPGVTVGWAAWFDNRRVGLRDRWFRLRTSWHYRGCPEP
jgi:hypothetical protein